MIELDTPNLYLSARLSHTWNSIMELSGYRDFCDSSTEFSWITYAYTKDCPEKVREFGENLWEILFQRFGGTDNNGNKVGKSIQPISTVTRRTNLWER